MADSKIILCDVDGTLVSYDNVIPTLDYGMVNAPKVLDLALTLTSSNA